MRRRNYPIPNDQYLIYLILVFSSLFLSNPSLAQNQIVDSLELALNNSQEDTAKVNLLNDLSYKLHYVDVDRCMEYANQALDLSKKLHFLKGEARAYTLLSIGLSFRGENKRGYELNQKAYDIAKAINDTLLLSSTLNNMAIYLQENGDDLGALKGYQQALSLHEKIRDTLRSCINIINIAQTHSHLGNKKEEHKYLAKAYSFYNQTNDPSIKIMALYSGGYLKIDQKKFEEAESVFNEGLAIAVANNDILSQIEGLLANSEIYLEMKKGEFATLNALEALKIAKAERLQFNEIYIHGQLAYIYGEQSKTAEAIKVAEKGLALAIERKLTDSQYEFHEQLADFYEKTADHHLAFQHLKTANTVKDSLNTGEQKKQALVLEAKYQNERKEIENQLLRAQASKNDAILSQRKAEIYVTILVLFGVSIITLLLYFAFLEKQKFNNKLKEEVMERTKDLEISVAKLEKSNSELESFAYIASHDLKEPIRNISSFTKLALRELPSTEYQVNEYLNFVEANAQQMQVLVEDVLEYSKFGHIEERKRKVNLRGLLQKVEQTLGTVIKNRNVVLKYDANLPHLLVSPTPLFILLKNLIENGIKYNESQVPIIQIQWKPREDGSPTIVVSDNGIGIEPAFQEKIFEMFKRLHNRSAYKGSGLGLSICKKIALNMGGQIELKSTPGKGSSFSIILPKDTLFSTPKKELAGIEK